MNDETLDAAVFAHLVEITGNDLAFIDELIQTYVEDAVIQIRAMREAAAAADPEAMVRPAHSLKSSSANVGAMALAEACRRLEADGRAGRVPDASERVDACEEAFAAARVALAEAWAASQVELPG